MGLVSAMAEALGEAAVVVDRTTGIGYSGPQFSQEEDALNSNGRLDVRDHIYLYECAAGGIARVRTHGMEKFGQANFLVENYPTDALDALRWILNDYLCPYAALQSQILAGQTFGYRVSAGGILAFGPGPEECLRVSDCEPPRTPVPGLATFLRIAVPLFEAWRENNEAETDEPDETASGADPSLAVEFSRKMGVG
jgi:hypothetical protein